MSVRLVLGAFVFSLVCLPGPGLRSEGPTLENAQPVVVKTVPEAGADLIDPMTKEIRVVFSKEMTPGSWSFGLVDKDSFPKTNGKARFSEDKKTCILPVQLEPGKTYGIWINSPKLTGFKDSLGQPSLPYLLVFRTKS